MLGSHESFSSCRVKEVSITYLDLVINVLTVKLSDFNISRDKDSRLNVKI